MQTRTWQYMVGLKLCALPKNVQFGRLCTAIATTVHGDSVVPHTSSSRARGSSADTTPTPAACRRVQVQRARPRPYPSLRQRKESLAAQSPATRGTDFESPTTRTLNKFKSLKSKLINVTKNIATWRKNEAQVASRPISNCPTETDFRTQTV